MVEYLLDEEEGSPFEKWLQMRGLLSTREVDTTLNPVVGLPRDPNMVLAQERNVASGFRNAQLRTWLVKEELMKGKIVPTEKWWVECYRARTPQALLTPDPNKDLSSSTTMEIQQQDTQQKLVRLMKENTGSAGGQTTATLSARELAKLKAELRAELKKEMGGSDRSSPNRNGQRDRKTRNFRGNNGGPHLQPGWRPKSDGYLFFLDRPGGWSKPVQDWRWDPRLGAWRPTFSPQDWGDLLPRLLAMSDEERIKWLNGLRAKHKVSPLSSSEQALMKKSNWRRGGHQKGTVQALMALDAQDSQDGNHVQMVDPLN